MPFYTFDILARKFLIGRPLFIAMASLSTNQNNLLEAKGIMMFNIVFCTLGIVA
jgi:hypothetical protein